MKKVNRILLVVGCIALLAISWFIVLNAKSNSEKQAELISQANAYTEDGVYILAVPLLEEASNYEAVHSIKAESDLKGVYLHLIDQRGYQRKYTDLLTKQMNRKEASPGIFMEAANYYLENMKFGEAYAVLRDGIEKTGSEELVALYEDCRYSYKIDYHVYEDVTAIVDTTIGVSMEGLWGLADSEGSLLVPCEYDKISTYSFDRAIVSKEDEVYAVDNAGNRLALSKEKIYDFGNYAEDRIALLTDEGWKRALGDFEMGSTVFEEIGTYSNGYAAAKQDGKWGLIDKENDWLIPPEYDGIVMDELRQSYAQGSVFVVMDDMVYQFMGGKQVDEAYEDAKPFGKEGYAAVKKDGKWGFVNHLGELKIECQFDNALSFGQHLASVQIAEKAGDEEDDKEDERPERWGYINLYGEVVIEPIFFKAKSFAKGNAPVLTERGWQILSLLEYKKEAGL